MPGDGLPLDDIKKLAELGRAGVQYNPNWRQLTYNINKAGYEPDEADRLAAAWVRLKGSPQPGFTDSGLSFVGEVASTLQKPVIALAGGIVQGRGPLEIAGEMVKAPFTAGRSFQEAGATGGGALMLDMVADPGLVTSVGAAAKVGRGGTALRQLGGVARELAMGNIQVNGKTIAKLSELMDAPVGSVTRAGRAADKVQESTKAAYSQFSEVWRANVKDQAKRRNVPHPDHMFYSNARDLVPASDLIEAGASGLTTFGIGTRRITPMRGAQAAAARFIEKRGGSAGRRVLQLDRAERMARAMRSGYTSRAEASQMAGEDIVERMERMATDAGYDGIPRGTEIEDLLHVRESVGRMQEGGFGAAGAKTRLAQDVHKDPDAAIAVMGKLAKAIAEKDQGKQAQLLEEIGFFTRRSKDGASREAIEAVNDVYDLGTVTELSRKVKAWRAAKSGADEVTFEDFLKLDEVQDEIASMAHHIFGVRKGSKEAKFLDHIDELFTKMGREEVRSGVLGRLELGYVPRVVTPAARAMMDRVLNGTGLKATFRPAIDPLSGSHGASLKRKWSQYTTAEIEDIFRRGELGGDFGQYKSWTPEKLEKHFATQVGATGWNRNFARFMGLFGRQDFLRGVTRADPELARFFLADPIVFATMRRAQFARVLNAKDFMRQGVKLFSIEDFTRGKGSKVPANENAGQFVARVASQFDTLGDPSDYRVVFTLGDDAGDEIIRGALKAEKGAEIAPDFASVDVAALERLKEAASGIDKPIAVNRAHIISREQAEAMYDYHRRVLAPPSLQSFGRQLQNLTSLWKVYALVPRPAYHFRNFISNNLQMIAGGMRPDELVLWNGHGLRFIRSMFGHKKGFDLEGLRPRGLVSSVSGRPTLQDAVIDHPVLGKMTREQVAIEMLNHGVWHIGFFPAELAREVLERSASYRKTGSLDKVWQGVGVPGAKDNAVTRAGHMLGSSVENWAKTSYFLWSLSKGKMPAEAAADVTKYFFNYSDMRPWEKTLRSTAIPFWSWARNNIPLQLRLMIQRPGVTALPAKLAMSRRREREIVEDIEPRWIANELGVPYRTEKTARGKKVTTYHYFGSYMPVADILRTAGAALGFSKQTASVLGLLPQEMQDRFVARGGTDDAWKHVFQQMNPVAMQAIEKIGGYSLNRLTKIEPGKGGMVSVPWLGGYITTPENASLIAMFPLIHELNNVMSSTDRHGRQISMRERFMRSLTGSPNLRGSETGLDLPDQQARYIRGRNRASNQEIGLARWKLRTGREDEVSMDALRDFVKRQQELIRSAASSRTSVGQP